jgi:hypothetical protein
VHADRFLACWVALGLTVVGCSNPPPEPQKSADPTAADTMPARGARGGPCGTLTSGYGAWYTFCSDPNDQCDIPRGAWSGTCVAKDPGQPDPCANRDDGSYCVMGDLRVCQGRKTASSDPCPDQCNPAGGGKDYCI